MTPFVRHLTRDVARVTLSCHIFLRAILTAVKRCWAGDDDPLMLAYHDREWGVPLHGDRELFAKLVLDGFQAGLSWAVILHKRVRFLEAFDGFDPEGMARYQAPKIAQLLRDPGIVRNRQKVRAALTQRGFRFVGPTICYAFMQAVGMVNDHLVTCFRHAEVRRLAADG